MSRWISRVTVPCSFLSTDCRGYLGGMRKENEGAPTSPNARGDPSLLPPVPCPWAPGSFEPWLEGLCPRPWLNPANAAVAPESAFSADAFRAFVGDSAALSIIDGACCGALAWIGFEVEAVFLRLVLAWVGREGAGAIGVSAFTMGIVVWSWGNGLTVPLVADGCPARDGPCFWPLRAGLSSPKPAPNFREISITSGGAGDETPPGMASMAQCTASERTMHRARHGRGLGSVLPKGTPGSYEYWPGTGPVLCRSGASRPRCRLYGVSIWFIRGIIVAAGCFRNLRKTAPRACGFAKGTVHAPRRHFPCRARKHRPFLPPKRILVRISYMHVALLFINGDPKSDFLV